MGGGDRGYVVGLVDWLWLAGAAWFSEGSSSRGKNWVGCRTEGRGVATLRRRGPRAGDKVSGLEQGILQPTLEDAEFQGEARQRNEAEGERGQEKECESLQG